MAGLAAVCGGLEERSHPDRILPTAARAAVTTAVVELLDIWRVYRERIRRSNLRWSVEATFGATATL